MRLVLILVAILAIQPVCAAAATASDISIREYRSDDTLLNLGRFQFGKGRTLDLSVGIGSGAFRHADDPPDVIWSVGDRGPNFACNEAKAIARFEFPACRDQPAGRIYLAPAYAPSIYRLVLSDDNSFRVTDVITLKDRTGRPLNGMPNPLRSATTEVPFDGRGQPLSQDVHGVDAEAIVRLTDGTFWIADENAPSLLHVSASGRVLARHVPQGAEKDFEGAQYDVIASLPAILSRRQVNRGIEGLAITPDERFLYVVMQSPLANPDMAAFRKSRSVRMFRIERTSMQVMGEFIYVLDEPGSFRRDPSQDPSQVRVSEAVAIAPDRLIVLERTDATTRLYEVSFADATNIVGTPWDDPRTLPSLEQLSVDDALITPVRKQLLFDSADFPQVASKGESLAILGDGALALMNDDDFGIEKAGTQIVVIRGLTPRPQ